MTLHLFPQGKVLRRHIERTIVSAAANGRTIAVVGWHCPQRTNGFVSECHRGDIDVSPIQERLEPAAAFFIVAFTRVAR
jgi:hypothetical protein